MRGPVLLPPGEDPERVRTACMAAVERLARRLPDLGPDTVTGNWTDATVDFVRHLIPVLVEGYFALLDGDREFVDNALRLVHDYGVDRARTGLSTESFVNLAMRTRSDVADVMLDEIGDDLAPETRLALYRGVTAVADEILACHLTAFVDERTWMNAEDKGTAAQVLQVSPAGFALGDREGRLIHVNETFSRFLNKPTAELIGSKWRDAVAIPGVDDLLRDAEEGRDFWRDVPCEDEFGVHRTLRITMRRHQGRVSAVAVDVSTEVELEEMRHEFLRGFIHDIRSPLTVMSGWAQTMLRNPDRLDATTRAQALESIVKAARQVRSMTDNLLELELLQSGAHRYEQHTFDAAERIGSTLIDSRGDALELEAPSGRHALIRCDVDAFDRIVSNLVDNAVSHGAPPVTIAVEVTDPSHVHIHVRDAGTVDAQIVTEAFDGRVKSSKGFGIGLRATRLLVEAIGGRIALSSTEPTQFTVSLPHA